MTAKTTPRVVATTLPDGVSATAALPVSPTHFRPGHRRARWRRARWRGRAARVRAATHYRRLRAPAGRGVARAGAFLASWWAAGPVWGVDRSGQVGAVWLLAAAVLVGGLCLGLRYGHAADVLGAIAGASLGCRPWWLLPVAALLSTAVACCPQPGVVPAARIPPPLVDVAAWLAVAVAAAGLR